MKTKKKKGSRERDREAATRRRSLLVVRVSRLSVEEFRVVTTFVNVVYLVPVPEWERRKKETGVGNGRDKF